VKTLRILPEAEEELAQAAETPASVTTTAPSVLHDSRRSMT
jgi:hypothetical protein